MKSRNYVSVIAGACLGFGCVAGSAAVKVEEQILVPKTANIGCAVGAHGVHLAAVMAKGSRTVVVYDGVESPKFDHLLTGSGAQYMHPMTGSQAMLLGDPIVFSPDGEHYAYFARTGADTVAMLDGKELTRFSGQVSYQQPAFTPTGNHLYFLLQTDKGYQLQVDDKLGPPSSDVPTTGRELIAFSPDGAHYAYIGTERNGERTKWAVIDGRQVKYFGSDLKFTGNGHLLSILTEAGAQTLILDGKGVMKAQYISQVWTSPTGSEVAAFITPRQGAPTLLTLNGKPVPGSEGLMVNNVLFSPDHKRLAAICSRTGTTMENFVLLDGKRGDPYQSIDVSIVPPAFSPDSAKFIYVAMNAGQSFLVINGEETDGCLALVPKPVFAAGGAHLAYGLLNNGKSAVYVDGKLALTAQGEDTFSFSPDGSRWAMLVAKALRVDGAAIPNLALTEWSFANASNRIERHNFLFSADSKHIAYLGADPANQKRSGLFVDQTLVFHPPDSFPGAIKRLDFSPDGQHLYWVVMEPADAGETQPHQRLYVDGEPSVKYALSVFNGFPATTWEIGADGTLQFLTVTDDGIKRIRVTPSAETSIAALLAAK